MTATWVRSLLPLILFCVFLSMPPGARGDEPLARVIGTGLVDLNDDLGLDIQFRETVTAFVDADGSVRGTVVSHVDYNGLFSLERLNTAGHVVQIVIEGNEAWVCAEIVNTNNGDVAPVGFHLIVWIHDLGGQRQDIMHAEIAEYLPLNVFDVNLDGIVDCYDQPRFFPSIVDQGNFQIR